MIEPIICPVRPTFPSAESYARNVAAHIDEGREPWGPQTLDEYRILRDEFPAMFVRYRSREVDALLGDDPPDVMDDAEFARFLRSIDCDPQRAKALSLTVRRHCR